MPLNAAELGQAKVWSIAHAQHIIGLPVEQALLQCVDHTNLGVETFAKVVWPTNQPTPEARTAQKFSADTRGIISTWRESGGHDLPVPHTDLSYDVSRLWFRAGSSIYIMSNFDPQQQT